MRFLYFYLMKAVPDRVREVAPRHEAYWRDLGLPAYLGGPFADRSAACYLSKVHRARRSSMTAGAERRSIKCVTRPPDLSSSYGTRIRVHASAGGMRSLNEGLVTMMDGWGAGWWLVGAVLMGFCIVMMVRMMSGMGHGHSEHGRPREGDEPERTLANRLARGEIDVEEYKRLLEVLRGKDPSTRA